MVGRHGGGLPYRLKPFGIADWILSPRSVGGTGVWDILFFVDAERGVPDERPVVRRDGLVTGLHGTSFFVKAPWCPGLDSKPTNQRSGTRTQ